MRLMPMLVGEELGDITLVECPRCVDGIDPERCQATGVKVCCGEGRYGCDSRGCKGPQETLIQEPTSCELCGGQQRVEDTEAFAYCLEVV